ncbi:MAG: heme biosynthesis HemY N-terminal domain-containing protein [Acetobacteraceae bacterium]
MRAVITFLVIAAVIIGAAWWVAALPGVVDAQIGTLAISLPTPVALLAAVVAFVVLYVLVRLLVMLLRLPGRSRRLRLARDRRRGETAVTRTLLALAGGDSTAAQKEARRSRTLLGDTPQTLLLAAYASRQAGQQEDAELAFRALAERKDAAFLGLRGLMQQAMARGDWEAAAKIARQAEDANPGAPWLRGERQQLAIRAGSWKEALMLSGPEDSLVALGTAAAFAEADTNEAVRLAKRAWQADSAFAPAALVYAKRLREAGKESRAQDVLRTSWGLAPNPELADLALAPLQDPAARLKRAEAMVTTAPRHAESHLLLARVKLAAGQTDEARRHAEAARDAGLAERRLWLLLADIAEKAGDAVAQADALRHAAAAEPDAAWRCGQCGTAQATWLPVCPACGTMGQIVWTNSTTGIGTRLLVSDGGEPILP